MEEEIPIRPIKRPAPKPEPDATVVVVEEEEDDDDDDATAAADDDDENAAPETPSSRAPRRGRGRRGSPKTEPYDVPRGKFFLHDDRGDDAATTAAPDRARRRIRKTNNDAEEEEARSPHTGSHTTPSPW